MAALAQGETWRQIPQRAERRALLTWKRVRAAVRPADASAKRRVIVAGTQRSGTNMTMDLLERSVATDVYHERDPRAFANYRMRPPEVIAGLIARSDAPCFVIKALCELQILPALMGRFAPAQVIWVVRRYDDVVNSMLRSFRNMAQQVQRIAVDRNASGWLGEGMSDATHARIRALVHPGLDDANASALQWYFRNVLALEHGLDASPGVRFVGYERLVSEPEGVARAMFGFLELPFSPAVTRWVHPRSVGKRAPPAIEAPIRDLCDGLQARLEVLVERDAG